MCDHLLSMAALWIRARLCFLGIALGGAGSYLIGGALFANVLLIGSFGFFVVAIVHAANTVHARERATAPRSVVTAGPRH